MLPLFILHVTNYGFKITPVSISSIGWKTYCYFAVFNAAFLPLIYFWYPETSRLSLEQIDRLFTGPKVSLRLDTATGDIESPTLLDDHKEMSVSRVDKIEH